MPPRAPALPAEAVDEPTPALLEEILEQVFLRLPPYEPASLVRASLASKHCLALLTGARFRGLYRDRHGAPPMLGFLASAPWDSDTEDVAPAPAAAAPPFVSTTAFRARVPGRGWGRRDYAAWDARHGRVLLGEKNAPWQEGRRLAVWDPMTGRRRELREPETVYGWGLYAAAVLCAASGCDHLACHRGPFRVVHLSLHMDDGDDFVAQARVSSPETYGCSSCFHWSEPCPGVSVGGHGHIAQRPPVLVNDALHFMLAHDGFDHAHYVEILKYDLGSNSLSLIDAPKAGASMDSASILMAMEDASLGFAHLKGLTLLVWSRQMGSDGVAAPWTQRSAVDLENLLPIQDTAGEDVRLLGSMEGSDIIFVSTDLGVYKIDLKSLQQEKISDEQDLVSLIPYRGYCNPREKGETR